MRVAIVHYHLEPGGVTSVIEAASRALDLQHVILIGGGGHPDGLPVGEVPGLGYGASTGQLLENLRHTASVALGGPPDVWHFHNPTLGKNAQLPSVVAALAAAGERLVLHLHDLAEDGRPENLSLIHGQPLYPVSARVAYAFINSRDRDIFLAAGLPENRAFLVANPVCSFPNLPSPVADAPLLFAPIRGIRRKNLGELVLLSALVPEGTRIAISREPRNLAAQPVHDAWRYFATSLGLPIIFDASASAPFQSWLERATHFITTSVSEGFGLPFLEAIACGKPMLGRDLPHLTQDHGISSGRLYQRIIVPVGWVENHPKSEDAFHDFGNLPEAIQKSVILHPDVGSLEVDTREGRMNLKAWLAEAVSDRQPAASLPERFSPESHARKLREIYQLTAGVDSQNLSYLNPEKILRAYQQPENFHFLCAPQPPVRAIIFDLYGTLILAPPGAVKPDSNADPAIRSVLASFGHVPPDSPSRALHAAVLRHHAASAERFPEVDLRLLWREILGVSEETPMEPLVAAIEAVWHPAGWMPGAEKMLLGLADSPLVLGILSNAQCHSLSSLGALVENFAPDLVLLSYGEGMAKPSPALFTCLRNRLAARGVQPNEVLFVGNDPLQDILPAAAVGFRTALFTGHPDAWREGDCRPDFVLRSWDQLPTVSNTPPPSSRPPA